MSIWYQHNVHAIAKDKAAVAKFFNLENSFEDVRTDMFEFSYGGKNAPSLTLRKIVKENPDIIFLVQEEVECDTVGWFITRFNEKINQQQFLWVQSFGAVTNKLSKKILEDYNKKYPTLVSKHLDCRKGYENFRWEIFFSDFSNNSYILDHIEDYKEMVNPWKEFNVKTYVIEHECNYGDETNESWIKEWQGPHPIGKIESIKNDINDRIKDGRMKENCIRNINIREVEPR
jgi:hypothetical protein